MKKTKKKLGEILMEAGVIDQFQLNSALTYQSEWGGRLGSIIVRKGFISEKELLRVITQQYGINSISLDSISRPSEEVLKTVKLDIARKFCIFPLEFDGKTLLTAVADPTDLKTLDDLGFMLGVRVRPVLALESEIERAIAKYYEGRVPQMKNVQAAAAPPQTDRPAGRPGPHPGQMELMPQGAKFDAGFSPNEVLGGLIDLLIDKNLITKDELIKKIILKGVRNIRITDQ